MRKIGRKEAGESRGFPILWMEIMEDVFHMKGKECKDKGKTEDVQEKIHATARKVLGHGIANFVWARGSGRGEVCGRRKKFSGREEGAERRMRLLTARGSTKLGKIGSGSSMQCFWLGNKKVESQVIGVDRSDSLRE